MGRNTDVLREIVRALDTELDDPDYALDALQSHFHHRLLVDVGNVSLVAANAAQLRLSISEEECARVLDEIAEQKMVGVTVDHVEQVVWDLFGNRFIEP